jgi:hypothetical protein
MTFALAQWLVTIFAVISLVHVYWALGGKWASVAAVPQVPVEGSGEVATGLQAAGLDYPAGGGCLVDDCAVGVFAGRLVPAAGASSSAAVGDQCDCAPAVRPGDWRFEPGGVFQGGQRLEVCPLGYLGLFAVVCGVGGRVVGGGVGVKRKSKDRRPLAGKPAPYSD